MCVDCHHALSRLDVNALEYDQGRDLEYYDSLYDFTGMRAHLLMHE